MRFLKEIYQVFTFEEKKNFFFLFLLILIGTVLELVSIGIVLPTAKIFTDSVFLNQFYEFTGIKKLETGILVLYVLFLFLIVFALKNFFLYIVLKAQAKFIVDYQSNLQIKVFNGYLSQEMSYLREKNSSTIMYNISNLCNFFCSIYINTLFLILIEAVVLIGILGMLLYFNFQITFLIIVVFGGLVLLIYVLNKKKLKNVGKARNFFSERQLENLQQAIGSIKEVKVLGKEFFFEKNFKNSTEELASANYVSSIISGTPKLLIEFITVLSFSSAIIILMTQGYTLTETFPLLAVYFVATYKLLPAFQKILFFLNRLKYSYPTAKQLINLLPELLKKEAIKLNKGSKKKFNNEININNVSFKYPKNNKLIFSNLNFKISKNSFIGISGESGVGKSTLIDIILGLIKPNSGSIQVDDEDIHKNLRDWQNTIGYVPQNIFLISDSIKKNIAFGLDDYEIDNKSLNQAIERSCLRNFIQGLKYKENTIVGENGSLISWGQRQRIGIARALYNNPSVLIFDEATNSLDPKTEENILQEIELLKKNLTLIFVSHKRASLKKCDKIFSIKNETILEISNNEYFV